MFKVKYLEDGSTLIIEASSGRRVCTLPADDRVQSGSTSPQEKQEMVRRTAPICSSTSSQNFFTSAPKRKGLRSELSRLRSGVKKEAKRKRDKNLFHAWKPSDLQAFLKNNETQLTKEWLKLTAINFHPDKEEDEKKKKGGDVVPFLGLLGLTSSRREPEATQAGLQPTKGSNREEQVESNCRVILEKEDQQVIEAIRRDAITFTRTYGSTFDVTCPLGKQLLDTKYPHLKLSQKSIEEWFLSKCYEKWCRSKDFKPISSQRFPKSLTLSSNRTRSANKQWSHSYCFSRKQKVEHMLTLESGLNKRSRLLQKICAPAAVELQRLEVCPSCGRVACDSTCSHISPKPEVHEVIVIDSDSGNESEDKVVANENATATAPVPRSFSLISQNIPLLVRLLDKAMSQQQQWMSNTFNVSKKRTFSFDTKVTSKKKREENEGLTEAA